MLIHPVCLSELPALGPLCFLGMDDLRPSKVPANINNDSNLVPGTFFFFLSSVVIDDERCSGIVNLCFWSLLNCQCCSWLIVGG